MPAITVREKHNPLAVHASCDSLDSAKRWISHHAPMYCKNGYFSDKTLTPDSFTVYVNGAELVGWDAPQKTCCVCGSQYTPCDCTVDR